MDYKSSSEVVRQSLVQSGLTPGQSALYEVLIQHGPLTATRLSFLAGVPRTLSYKLLGELEDLELVTKTENPGEVGRFVAAHPLKLKELADKRVEEAKNAKSALDSTLAKLISDFNTVAGQPGVRILEGVAGIAELYEDQLNERQPLKLIRSVKDRDEPGLKELIDRQMTDRVKLGISTRAITPLRKDTPAWIIASDAQKLVERRIVPAELLSVPAQVFIYANKVAITSYDGAIITTLIENTAIRQTFEILFEYIWTMSAPEDKVLRGAIEANR